MGRSKMMKMGLEKCDDQKRIGEVDESKTPLQRSLEYLSKVGNPHSLNMQGYQVELEWANTDITLQDRLEEMFASL